MVDQDGTIGDGAVSWAHALDFAAGMNTGVYPQCAAGYSDWRLLNILELSSLIDYGFSHPVLPNTLGTDRWSEGDPFQGVRAGTDDYY